MQHWDDADLLERLRRLSRSDIPSVQQQTMARAADEIGRLQEAKRHFSALADAKGKENVELRQENERLRSLLSDAASIIDDAQSGYISGCSNDLAWDGRREAFLQAARNAEQTGDGK